MSASSASASSRRRSQVASQATTRPITAPTATSNANSPTACSAEKCPLLTAASAIAYAVIAVPSFTSDSPSRIVTSRSGAPRR